MNPSPPLASSTSKSKKLIHHREEASCAGVGAFHVNFVDLDGNHDNRQTAESETATTQIEIERAFDDDSHFDIAIADAVYDDDTITPITKATQYDPDSTSPLHKNRMFRLFGFVGLYTVQVIIVMACLIIAVTWNNRKSDKIISADASGKPTAFPTPGPTIGREDEEGIMGQLMKISSIEKLNDPNSAQFKAAQWILYQDPHQLVVDADNLFQRYALVVMYYSLQENGPWATCGEDDTSHQNSTLCDGRDPHDAYDDDYLTEDYEPFLRKDSNKWLSAEDECYWFGIYCNSDGNAFRIYMLVDNNLVGTLPRELSTLTFLEYFILNDNQLRGPVPVWFSEYRHLGAISLGSNQFTGPIPEAIYDMMDLEMLVLDANMLSGTISTQIGELRNLTAFSIGGNVFSGTIPTEFGLLHSLVYAMLSKNRLTGSLPSEFGSLTMMETFYADLNEISGTLPPEIGKLQELEYFQMNVNLLEGKLPYELYNLLNLYHLNLGSNLITGTITSQVGQLSKLEFLHLANNYITGTIPTELGKVFPLVSLEIQMNKFVGPVPNEICLLGLWRLEADCGETNAVSSGLGFNKCNCCTVCCDQAKPPMCLAVDE